MLGKASEIKSAQVWGRYEYPDSDYTNRRYVTLQIMINRKLVELGDASILGIQFQMSVDNDGDTHESALIIYKEGESE